MNKMNIEQELSVLKQGIIDQQELINIMLAEIKHFHKEITKIKEVLPPVTDFDIFDEGGD